MEQSIITFRADEQQLVKTGGVDKYASSTVSYVEAQFTLGENWTGFDSVRAMWRFGGEVKPTVLAIENGVGVCQVPHELLEKRGKVLVNLVGSIVEDEVVSDRLTTHPIIALITTSVALVNSEEEEVTPSQFEQFVAIVKSDADRAEDARDDAESAESSASQSAEDADIARINAESAQNSAEIAQGKAEDAQEEAERLVAQIQDLSAQGVQLLPSQTAYASYNAQTGILTIGIPQGVQGVQGEQGEKGDKGDTGATGETGATGNGIAPNGIQKTGTSGLVDTYTITFTNGQTTTFEVTNGEDGSVAPSAIASDYSSSATYAVGDYVWYEGDLYRCVSAISVGEVWTQSHWTEVALADEVSEAKSNIAELQDSNDALKGTCLEGKTKVESTSSVVLLSGKNLIVPKIPQDVSVTVKGRNRLDIQSAAFSFSGNASHHTLTKENGGIKVICDMTSASSYVYAYTDYEAEYDGTLYFSCEADCDGRGRKSVRDLRVALEVNNVRQELIYGRGLLFERVNVTAGDTVRICFYTHAGTEQGNTVYYKNIMLAYGDLYDYMPYIADLHDVEQVSIWQRVNLPTDSSKWTNASRRTSSGGGYYCKLTDSSYDIPSTSPSIPEANTDVPNIRSNEDVVYWNQLYGITDVLGPNGVSVSKDGVIGINHDNGGRSDVVAWLATNPVYIEYDTGETKTVSVRLIDRIFSGGEIVVFSEAVDFAYYRDDNPTEHTVVCLGDSITGMFGNGADYPTMIDLTTNIVAINAGFSGCRWTDHSADRYIPFSMNRLADAIATGDYTTQDASSLVNPESSNYDPLYAEHLTNLKSVDWNTVDFITLFWGTNDYLSSVIINSSDDPSVTDKQHTNVEDAVSYSISTILTAYPHLRIIVLTPYWQTPDGVDSDVATDNNGKYLIDFVNKIADVASTTYHLPVLNLYKTMGVNMIDKYYFQKDDAHPTERLKWIIAHRIINAIMLD